MRRTVLSYAYPIVRLTSIPSLSTVLLLAIIFVIRRSWFFGSDMGVVGLHFGRSLLGEETVGLGDFILKMCSLEYSSLEGVIRDETWKAIQT